MSQEKATTETLLELKQKEFTNIFVELPQGLTVNTFFQVTKTIGLVGDQVHFVLVSLDFQGDSLPGRVTRSGEFSPKNVTHFGYFPANLQNFWAIFRQIAEMWAIPLPKFWFWHFFGTFWLLLWTQSGNSATRRSWIDIVRLFYSNQATTKDNTNHGWLLPWYAVIDLILGTVVFFTKNCLMGK